MNEVLQPWLKECSTWTQLVVFASMRITEEEQKEWANGAVVITPTRHLACWLRWCSMIPPAPTDVDDPVDPSFLSTPPSPFQPDTYFHHPAHWLLRVMHALEIIGYYHSDAVTRDTALQMYLAIVDALALHPENVGELDNRLRDGPVLL